ncbi:hypothetical protein JYG34_16355 [Pseudomonas entomophila]|uniref:hypothetical protein n=1 Tax=Pseudomonas entomophila TaxID=312306 RepID=UPI001BCC4FD1|nr:hypothetical protein [Pseudomonas entomophila]QVM89592.1 hypothetical protein JYG34_16355 [Pseudomonas entomophila]
MDDIINHYLGALNPQAWDSCRQRTPFTSTCTECFSRQYFGGNVISYRCEEKRKLYVLRYLPVHMHENRSAMDLVPPASVDRWLNTGKVRVLSIGGGPGSDLSAVIDFLRERSDRPHYLNVEMTRLDIQPLWEEIALDVVRRSAHDIYFTLREVQADVLSAWPSNVLRQYDIITISYLISEIAQADFEQFALQLQGHLAQGGALIINERPQENLQLSIDQIYASLGIDQFVKDHNKRRIDFDYPEHAKALVGPKLRMTSFASVGIKQSRS